MSKSMVRDAFDGSVTCRRLCEKFHASHVSTVPKASSPRSAFARAPGTLSSIQAILVPLKYGSSTRPVLFLMMFSTPDSRSSAHFAAVRRSCHTIALCKGSPLWRSQRIAVSRWLVMPAATISAEPTSARSNASRATSRCDSKISLGSCSTQPGLG
jgi:hypothetical protein